MASALHQAKQALCARISARIPAVTATAIGDLADVDADGDAGADNTAAAAVDGHGEGLAGPALLAWVKADPGSVSLESMLTEIAKLQAARAIGLPAGLFADVAPKVVAGWRARAAVEAPSHLRTHPVELRPTLLAARERELTDTLVELLIATVHRINARAKTWSRSSSTPGRPTGGSCRRP